MPKVGRYAEELALDEAELKKWNGRNISSVSSCNKCKYALFCGGGCPAHAILTGGGDAFVPYCDEYPRLFHTLVPEIYEAHAHAEE